MLLTSVLSYAQTCEACYVDENWTFSADNDELDDEFWEVEHVDTDNDDVKDAFAVVGGTQFSGGAGRQGVLYLLSEAGSIVSGYPKYFGSSGSDIFYAVEQATNGNLIICGAKESSNVGGTNSDNVWFVEFDLGSASAVVQREYGGTGNEWGFDIKEAPTGLYVMVAKSGKNEDEDLADNDINAKGEYWILDIDPDTYQINWDETYSGTYTGVSGLYYDMATSLVIDGNGHYMVAGHCKSCDPDKIYDEVMIVNIDPSDYSATTDDIFGYEGHDQISWDLIQTEDDGFFSAGVTHPNIPPGCFDENEHDGYLFITDDELTNIWTGGCQLDEGLGFGGSYADNFYSAAELPDGSFLFAGETKSDNYDVTCNHNDPDTYSDAWLMKVNEDGEWQWSESFGAEFNDYWRSIKRLEDGSFIMASSKGADDLLQNQNYYVIKFQLADCEPPENLDVVDVDGCEAILAWEMEDCVPDYKLKVRKSTSSTWFLIDDEATSPYTFEGDPGFSYQWRVEALCSPDETSNHTNGDPFSLTTCNPKIGINDSNETGSLTKIYPNPSNGSSEIAIPDSKEQDQTVTIEKINHLGKVEVVSSVPLLAGLIQFSLPNSDLSAGIYLVRVITDSKVYQAKLALTRF
ncbi:MAG: T9SS type A sorting domain-containing protein [Bacteroidetes bacterium]|nr:T9SS type A sorting domain-containing protein [Bacteroidota bacterium]